MIQMITETWPSKGFKVQMIEKFHETLRQSDIIVAPFKFEGFNKKEVIHWLLQIGEEPFVGLAQEYLEEMEEEEDYENNVSLYHSLIRTCFRMQGKYPLQKLIERLSLDTIFQPEMILGVVAKLYSEKDAAEHSNLEKALFTAMLRALQKAKSLPLDIADLQQLFLDLLKMKSRLEKPHECLRFCQEIKRLKIYTDSHLLSEFEEAENLIKETIPKAVEASEPNISPLEKLKELIKNDLHLLEKHKFSASFEKEVLVLNLEKLAALEGSWKERDLFFQALKGIAKTQLGFNDGHISRLLRLFQQNLIPSEEVLKYYLAEKDPLLMPCLIEPVLSLLSNIHMEHSDGNFVDAAEYLLQTINLNPGKLSMRKSCVSGFLRQLNTQNLAKETLKIVNLMHKASLRFYEPEAIINACEQVLAHSKDTLTPETQELLFEIPKYSIHGDDSKDKLRSLYEHCFSINMEKNDIVNSIRCLEKEMSLTKICDNNFYERAFKLIRQLAESGHAREAEHLIAMINPPDEFDFAWMDIFRILLKNGHLSSCTKLFENKNALKFVSQTQFKYQLEEILEEMILQAAKLTKKNDDTTQKQLNFLCRNILKLIFQNQPSNLDLWTTFIETAAESAQLGIVEKILSSILLPENCPKLLTSDLKANWLIKLLERLAKDGSKKFLNVNEWWSKAWGEFPITTLESCELIDVSKLSYFEKTKLISQLLAYRAMDWALRKLNIPSKWSEERAKLDKKLNSLRLLINGATRALDLHLANDSRAANQKSQDVINIIDNKNMARFENFLGFDPQCINLVNIFMRTVPKKNRVRGMYVLLNKFYYTAIDPIDEHLTISLFNHHLQKLAHSNDEDIRNVIFTLMPAVLQSENSVESHYFDFLEYFKLNYPYEEEKNVIKLMEKENGFDLKIELGSFINNYLLLLDKIIKGILYNHHKKKVSKEEKRLFRWAIDRMWKVNTSVSRLFFDWGMNHTNLSTFLSKKSIKKLSDHKEKLDLNFMQKNVDIMCVSNRIIGNALERKKIFQSFGFGDRFQMLKDEKRIYNIFRISIILSVVTILGFTAFIINNVFRSRSS